MVTTPKLVEAVQAPGMRAGMTVNVTPEHRRRHEAIVSDRRAPQKHVWRGNIILATADRLRRLRDHAPLRAFHAGGLALAGALQASVQGLLRDKTRQSQFLSLTSGPSLPFCDLYCSDQLERVALSPRIRRHLDLNRNLFANLNVLADFK